MSFIRPILNFFGVREQSMPAEPRMPVELPKVNAVKKHRKKITCNADYTMELTLADKKITVITTGDKEMGYYLYFNKKDDKDVNTVIAHINQILKKSALYGTCLKKYPAAAPTEGHYTYMTPSEMSDFMRHMRHLKTTANNLDQPR